MSKIIFIRSDSSSLIIGTGFDQRKSQIIKPRFFHKFAKYFVFDKKIGFQQFYYTFVPTVISQGFCESTVNSGGFHRHP
jgi:hypothetical protein